MAIKKKAGRLSPTPMGDYDNTTIYRRLDWVYYGGTSYICKRNNTIGIVPSDTEKWQKLIELPTELDMIFDEVTTRENITSGDKLSVILGKIKKMFSDLEDVAFSGSYNDLSNTPNSLKNPNKLNIKLNGASQISYDGSIAKEIDVTPSAISAVNTSTILTTKEQISANTNSSSVTGALAAKAMMTDYNDKITQLNSDLAFENFPDGTILEYYQKNPKIRGCFCVRPHIPTDLPASFSKVEGYLQFFRDKYGNRVLVVYWSYGAPFSIITRDFYNSIWQHDWKIISADSVIN